MKETDVYGRGKVYVSSGLPKKEKDKKRER
jgi:hypothetical protein